MESAICHQGGVCTAIRTNIRIGDVNGMIDPQNARVEFGFSSTGKSKTTAATRGITTRNCVCCPSCSELTIAPTAAYMVLYKAYPSRKNTANAIKVVGERTCLTCAPAANTCSPVRMDAVVAP